MTVAQLRRLFSPALVKKMRSALWLNQYTIDISYGTLEKCAANIFVDVKYKTLEITIDPAQIESKEGALRLLRHELLHAVVGRYRLYQDKADCLVQSRDMQHVLDTSFTEVDEETVGHLECIMDWHGLTPMSLVGKEE